MRLKDITVTGKTRSAVKATDVDRFEKEFWITFPKGYREFITRFGEGLLGNFVRIYPPQKIQAELEEWRERIREYWFWDAGRKLLPKSRALESFILGDTVIGDELVFHPARPGHLFVLPRDSEKIFDAGTTLLDSLEFLCRSGKRTEPVADLTFEPFDRRKAIAAEKRSSGKKKASDPPGQSCKDLLRHAERWAKRHDFVKVAKGRIEHGHGYVIPNKQLQITSQELSLVFEPRQYETKGFRAAFTLFDKTSKLELGVLSVGINSDETSIGSRFELKHENSPKLKLLYESAFDKRMREIDEMVARGEVEVIEEGEPQ